MIGVEVIGLKMIGLEVIGLEMIGEEMIGVEVIWLEMIGKEIIGLEMIGSHIRYGKNTKNCLNFIFRTLFFFVYINVINDAKKMHL